MMIPLPRILFEFYVRLWGDQTARTLFHPAPLGTFK
jgi:hypothetical protein